MLWWIHLPLLPLNFVPVPLPIMISWLFPGIIKTEWKSGSTLKRFCFTNMLYTNTSKRAYHSQLKHIKYAIWYTIHSQLQDLGLAHINDNLFGNIFQNQISKHLPSPSKQRNALSLKQMIFSWKSGLYTLQKTIAFSPDKLFIRVFQAMLSFSKMAKFLFYLINVAF